MSDGDTTRLRSWICRLQKGDGSALNELLTHFEVRLARLTRRMLDTFPGVRRWEQTGDILQGATLRLQRALKDVSPANTRDFFRLAALQIRRELLNLAERHRLRAGPSGIGRNCEDPLDRGPAEREDRSQEEPSQLAAWTEFHEAAQGLPDDEREVFDLLWYQGLTQDEAAAILGVSDRTIRSRWQAARLRIHRALGGQLPGR